MSSDPCLAIILPQRYDMIASKVGQMLPNPEGHWVCHTSYEKLADRWQAQREHIRHLHKMVADLEAENERLKLKKFTSEELLSIKAQVGLLQAEFKRDIYNQALAELERLRKAGDACAVACRVMGADTLADEWEAAKGVQP